METCQKLLEFPAARKKNEENILCLSFQRKVKPKKSLPVVADANEMEDVFLSQNSFFALLSSLSLLSQHS